MSPLCGFMNCPLIFCKTWGLAARLACVSLSVVILLFIQPPAITGKASDRDQLVYLSAPGLSP